MPYCWHGWLIMATSPHASCYVVGTQCVEGLRLHTLLRCSAGRLAVPPRLFACHNIAHLRSAPRPHDSHHLARLLPPSLPFLYDERATETARLACPNKMWVVVGGGWVGGQGQVQGVGGVWWGWVVVVGCRGSEHIAFTAYIWCFKKALLQLVSSSACGAIRAWRCLQRSRMSYCHMRQAVV